MNTTPERTLAQRREALDRANAIREYRAKMKRDLKAGRVQPETLIVDPPEWLETCKVWDLLVALPKIGRVKANKIMQTARMSPAKTVGGITDRQRRELLDLLAIRP
jgi:hypothetical protein